MLTLSPAPATGTAAARFAAAPWADDDPRRLDLEQRLPPDHLARRLAQAVARLDLSVLQASYAGTGSLPYPPALLLPVVLYELQRGQHRPATWFRDSHEHEPVRWLLAGFTPSRSCWYAFRDRLGAQLDELNRQVLHVAVAQELTPAQRGALDGTTVAANASRHKLVNETTLTQRLAQLAAVTPAPTSDPPAPTPLPTPAPVPAAAPAEPPAWMAPTPAGRQQQQQRLQQAQTILAARQQRNRAKIKSKQTDPAKVRLSPADPEAALGLDKQKVFRPLYNVQLLDDLDSPFLLAYEVFAQPNDAGVLGPMLARQQQLVGKSLHDLLADSAYLGGADLAAAAAAQVTVYGPWQSNDYSAGKESPAKQIPKSEFRWLPQEQAYVCPQGQRLEFQGAHQQRRSGPEKVRLEQYRCLGTHCSACPLQSRCTRTPAKGRLVTRSEHEELIEALRARMATAEGKALYRLRRQTVELVNADWKEHRQLRRFSGRGLARARGQVGALVLAHNLVTLLAEEKRAGKKPGQPLPSPTEPLSRA